MKRTREIAVSEAWQKRERMEAIVENVLRKYGNVSDHLAEELQNAQIDYAVAKDDLYDPFMTADPPHVPEPVARGCVKLYSYVVHHDDGYAPNPYFRFCTLCRCKFLKKPGARKNIVELAKKDDWIVGTAGANRHKSAGRGKLVYAMQVEKQLTREEYFNDSDFEKKKPVKKGAYEQTRGDNIRPRDDFERKQFALASRHFYYFGKNAIDIPKRFDVEKKGPGFRSHFEQADVCRFLEWLEKDHAPGKHGDPCYREVVDEPAGSSRCKSAC